MSDASIRSRSKKSGGSGRTFTNKNRGGSNDDGGFLSPKSAIFLSLLVIGITYWAVIRSPENEDGGDNSKKIYAVVIDAGSTGSRVNGYEFDQDGDGDLKLRKQLFEEIKPGLSSYADKPKEGANELNQLLKKAKDFIPQKYWKSTPIALKATAGLRLLPKEKAEAILTAVQNVIDDSGFVSDKDSVGIMDGMEEGIFSWFTLNFLLGKTRGPISQTAAALDLGGGSTQITVAVSTATASQYASEDIENVSVSGENVPVFTHSYLGLGLQSARKSILSTSQKDPASKILTSPCVNNAVSQEWKHGGETYTVKGIGGKDKKADWDTCHKEIVKLIQDKRVDKPKDLLDRPVVLFSYFFERAVEVGLIDPVKGGHVTVEDYLNAGKKACATIDEDQPLLCLDVTFMGALLHDGYGIKKDTRLRVVKKVDGYEVNWALGLVYQLLQK